MRAPGRLSSIPSKNVVTVSNTFLSVNERPISIGGGFFLTCVTEMVHVLGSLFCVNVRIVGMIQTPDSL
jgi:hypothetical protein